MKKLKRIPKFESEDQERRFWAKADSSEYFDWTKAEKALFPNLRPTTESISLRVPKYLRYSLSISDQNISVRESPARACAIPPEAAMITRCGR